MKHMIDKKCVICGGVFQTNRQNIIVCSSDICRKIDRKNKRKAYINAHPEYYERQKEYQRFHQSGGALPHSEKKGKASIWMDMYNKADRLGQIAMILRVWNDVPHNQYIDYGAWQNMSPEKQFKIIAEVMAIKGDLNE